MPEVKWFMALLTAKHGLFFLFYLVAYPHGWMFYFILFYYLMLPHVPHVTFN